jgi:thioester reductase-like protein
MTSPVLSEMTLINLLGQKAALQANKTAFSFLADGEEVTHRITYQELDHAAKLVAANLSSSFGVQDRVLLVLNPSIEYIKALFGCFYAGMIALPIYPPDPNSLAQSLSVIENIVKDAQPKIVLTLSALEETMATLFASSTVLKDLQWIVVDKLIEKTSLKWQSPKLSGDDLAVLLYTSGSTGIPKGVMLSHSNLIHNAEIMSKGCEITPTDKLCTWVPPYHVSGLFAGIVWPVFAGMENVIFSPQNFLAHPLRWLKAIDNYGVTISGAPNFAYELCNNAIADQDIILLDLSRWRIAISGGEAIRYETINKFCQKFSSAKFNTNTFWPMFGLTESTMISTGGVSGRGVLNKSISRKQMEKGQAILTQDKDDTLHLVGSGQALKDMTVKIVDPEKLIECAENQIGEIWVSGPSVAKGYWQKADLSEKIFQARLSNSQETFLRTGDLGYFQSQELYITGRWKEIIIIRGINHYPEDIEKTVRQSSLVLTTTTCAAFSIDISGQEQLAIAIEVNANNLDLLNLIGELRKAVANKHGLQIQQLFLLKSGQIPKTRTNKVQRKACAQLASSPEWQAQNVADQATESKNTINTIREVCFDKEILTNVSKLATYLQNKLAKILHTSINCIEIEKTISQLGVDSLATVQFIAEIRNSLNVEISAGRFFDKTTLKSLAQDIVNQQNKRDKFEQIDFLAEAKLSSKILCNNVVQTVARKNPVILLTGTTGFLGGFLLKDLLKLSPKKIYCLVRANNIEQAKSRLEKQLLVKIGQDSTVENIEPILGSLSQARLGLSEKDFKQLASEVDLIYHNGAAVNFVAPYFSLKKENVESVIEILKLAGEEKAKLLHFVSTLAVFSTFERSKFANIFETDRFLDANRLFGGYAQSKWVAEEILYQAQNRGFKVNIYRAGLISGDSHTGYWNTEDFFCRLIKGCIQLGYYPDIDLELGLTPVDYVSQAIIELSQNSINKTFHLVNLNSIYWQNLVQWMKTFGYSLKPLSYTKWQETLKYSLSQSNALYPLIPFLTEQATSDKVSFLEIFSQNKTPRFDCTNTEKELKNKIQCKPVNNELLNIYFSYLTKIGFLPTPQ